MVIHLPEAVAAAIQQLNQNGYQAYAVGGCVRDSLLGREPHDWDITTNALPEQIMTVFQTFRVIPTGIRHGTVTVIIDDMPLEITTYRVDGTYSDCRHPDSVSFTASLEEDLRRRDFTVNALAYHPEEGMLDYFSGLADLSQRRLVAVGNPEKRFSEDALRILRAIRFSAQLEFSIEKATERAMLRLTPLLSHIAVERVASELEKLICSPDVQAVMDAYPSVITAILPELEPTVSTEQTNPYHYLTVYQHTAKTIASVPPTPVLRWTMLFHDCGKPACHTRDEKGVDHFYGHAAVGSAIAERTMERLHLSRYTIDTVKTLVYHHDDLIDSTDAQFKHLLCKMGPDTAMQLLTVMRADACGKTPESQGETFRMLDAAENRMKELIDRHACFSLKDLAVSGTDLQNIGFVPGRMLGDALQQLLDDVIDDRVPNERTSLLKRAADYLKA